MSELMDGCILLDDATSALDGLELLVQTRQAKGSFPLVLMTTQAGADFSANAIKAGIATLIERPFSDDALFAANPFRPVREKRDGRARRHSKRGQCDRGMHSIGGPDAKRANVGRAKVRAAVRLAESIGAIATEDVPNRTRVIVNRSNKPRC